MGSPLDTETFCSNGAAELLIVGFLTSKTSTYTKDCISQLTFEHILKTILVSQHIIPKTVLASLERLDSYSTTQSYGRLNTPVVRELVSLLLLVLSQTI